jgi:hypothetical protein
MYSLWWLSSEGTTVRVSAAEHNLPRRAPILYMSTLRSSMSLRSLARRSVVSTLDMSMARRAAETWRVRGVGLG